MVSSDAGGSISVDPELEALPEPRRPFRRATLVTMGATAIAALFLASTLVSQGVYATRSGDPVEVGPLTGVQLTSETANRWVHATGDLGSTVVQYRRPLDRDTYRLYSVPETPRLWVEVRVPAGLEVERYVPPTSFVGRLVPVSDAGLSYSSIPDAVRDTTDEPLPEDAWLLIDGEAPATSRWVLGVLGLLLSFVVFNVGAMIHLLRPVR